MEIVKAYNIKEALKLVNEGFLPMAGCTNILVYEKVIGDKGEKYVDLTDVKELYGISEDENGLTIGAMTTFAELEEALSGKPEYKTLFDAAYIMGGPQIRNRATVAGNIADSSPAADSSSPLLVLDARITALSVSGERTIGVKEFFIAPRKTALKENEIITKIYIPASAEKSFYRKVGLRNAMAIGVVSLAGARTKDGEIRLAMGSVAPVPVRLWNVEKVVNGTRSVNRGELFDELSKDILPIGDIRASAEYRKTVAENILADSLEKEFGYEII